MAAERILVIEDEPGARTALESLLAEEGYTVCTAENGRAGLERIDDFHPDTIVCDFYLPDIDGLTVLRQARIASRDGITFIFVTGGCGGDEAESRLRQEADFFFHKPLDLSRLRRVLQRPSRPHLQGRVHLNHAFQRKGASNGRV
jgi:two-component system nitrogen regulation response regulator NtrX